MREQTWKFDALILSCSRTADEKRWETSSKGRSLRGRSPFGKRYRRPWKRYISGKCSNPSCDSWHPPVCQNHKNRIGRTFGEQCPFMDSEDDSQPNKRPKKEWWKSKNSTQAGCVCQDLEPAKSNSIFTEGHKIIGTKMQRASLKGCITPRQKFGKERVHRRVFFGILNLMSAALMLKNMRTGLKKRL